MTIVGWGGHELGRFGCELWQLGQLGSESAYERERALVQIVKLRSALAVPFLIESLAEARNAQPPADPWSARAFPGADAASIWEERCASHIEALHRRAVAGLARKLGSPDVLERRWAAYFLWRNAGSRDARSLLPALERALCDPDTQVRSRAAAGLGQLGSAALPAMSALREALLAEDPNLAAAAAQALAQLGNAGMEVLRQAQGHADGRVRELATRVLHPS